MQIAIIFLLIVVALSLLISIVNTLSRRVKKLQESVAYFERSKINSRLEYLERCLKNVEKEFPKVHEVIRQTSDDLNQRVYSLESIVDNERERRKNRTEHENYFNNPAAGWE